MGLSELFADFVSAVSFTEVQAEAPPAEENTPAPTPDTEEEEAPAEEAKEEEAEEEEEEAEEEEEEEEEEEVEDIKPKLEEGESCPLFFSASVLALVKQETAATSVSLNEIMGTQLSLSGQGVGSHRSFNFLCQREDCKRNKTLTYIYRMRQLQAVCPIQAPLR